jgi:N-acyl-L-homoserine lactone synthetase
LDHDEFDEQAAHIVVLDRAGQVLGAVRLSHCRIPWMLDTVFADIAPEQRVSKHWDTMEASRLVVAKEARSGAVRLSNGRGISELICKGVYNYCQLHGVRYLYMVTTTSVHRHLRQVGVSSVALGDPKIMADGVPTLAARLDWDEVVRADTLRRWYQAVHLVPLPAVEHRVYRKSGTYRIRSSRLRSYSSSA